MVLSNELKYYLKQWIRLPWPWCNRVIFFKH